jgi:hypothetical protein
MIQGTHMNRQEEGKMSPTFSPKSGNSCSGGSGREREIIMAIATLDASAQT